MFGFFFGFGYGARNTLQSHYVDFLATTASRSQLSYSEMMPLRRRKPDITKPERQCGFRDRNVPPDFVVRQSACPKLDSLPLLYRFAHVAPSEMNGIPDL